MSMTLEGLAALVNDRFDALTAVVREHINAEPPPGGPPPPSGPSPSDLIAAFKAKYAPRTPAEFVAKYGTDPGKPLPALPTPLDPAAVMDRARDGYDWQGRPHPGPETQIAEGTPEDVCAVAMDEIAHGSKTSWWTGYGQLDPDVSAVGVKTGFFATKGVLLFITGSPRRPEFWKAVSFDDFVKAMPGGPAGTFFNE